MRIVLHVNGGEHDIDVPRGATLLDVLRDDLGLLAARLGCGEGKCGACTVLADGRAIESCNIPIEDAEGRRIVTVEGLAAGERLHPLQQAFIAEDAMQCGYCTSGMLMACAALLEANPAPSDREIEEALARHLCRCGVYGRVVRAVRRAAGGAP